MQKPTKTHWRLNGVFGGVNRGVFHLFQKRGFWERYLDQGFLELGSNTAERTVRPVTLGRKIIHSWAR
jgi:hypothetical protein